MTKKLVIDAEFQKVLEPHSPEELQQLEENLMNDGCRDAIVVWKGKGIIVEGATRKILCDKHDIPYKINSIAFESREEVVRWIVDNQLGRRNISAEAKHAIREARIKIVEKLRADGNSLRSIAETAGVSESQIRRDLSNSPENNDSGAPPGAPEMNNSAKNDTSSNKGEAKKTGTPETVTGKDGKTYKARNPRKKTSKPKDEPKEEDPNKSIESFCRRMESDYNKWKEEDVQQANPWLKDRWDGAKIVLRDFLTRLRTAKTDDQCPQCKGEGCHHCRGVGDVPHQVYQRLT